MLDRRGKELIEELDDESFCECLIALMQNPTGVGLPLLYEEWVLARLRLVKQRSVHLFYGRFLTPLRQVFPRQVFPPDIMEAMRGVTTQPQAEGGDLAAETLMALMSDLNMQGPQRGLMPAWQTLSDYYTVRRGEMTIVTGVASHGKSTFIQNLCVNLAKDVGWNISLFCPEHYPVGHLGLLLMQHYTGQSNTALSTADFTQAKEWVADHFHCIATPDEVQPTLPWILAVARLQKERYGLEALVIDPWNEVEHCHGQEETETQYISSCLSQVRRFARTHNIHVWIIAHPHKLQRAVSGPYSGKYPPPTPYEISGSAHWYNKADNCLSIWRDTSVNSRMTDFEVEIHIQKIRNRITGRLGKVNLRYNGYRFHDVGDMQVPHWTERDEGETT